MLLLKKTRHKVILDLIEQQDVATQDELLELLLERGYSVTQATVSRDVKKLGLVKSFENATGIHVDRSFC